MEPRTESVRTVVHVGHAGDRVREAAAKSTVVDGPDRVVTVDPAAIEDASPEPTDVGLIVCEPTPASGAETLVAIREACPGVPSLAVVADDAAIDDALAAGATDVLVRREGVDEPTLLARRMDTVATTPPRPPLAADANGRLLDAIDDAFYTLDTDGALMRWNDRFREIAGYDDDELEGKHALELFAGADRDRVGDAIETVLETGTATVEVELISKGGAATPIEFTGALVTDAEGTPRGIVGIGRDVTDRREREGQLLRLRQAVETVVDSAPLTLFEVEPDGTVSTVRGETLSRRLRGRVAPGDDVAEVFGDRPRVRRAVDAAFAGESSHDLVDLGDATLEAWLQPLLDETGAVSRVIGLTLDVTEREERAGMLDQIQANAGEVIWMTAPNKGAMDFVTDSYETVWGRSPGTLDEDATSFVEAVHPDDRERVEAALAEQCEDPDAYEETYRVVRPDGEVRWVHDRASGVYEDGELTRIVGIATDVTVRKRRERELRLKNRAVEAAPVGIAIHEATGAERPVTYANEAFEAITGYGPDSIAGESLSVLVGDATDGDRVRALERALEAGDHRSRTAVLHRADGTPFWGRIDVAPVVGASGDVTHAVAFVQDVTESKEHEQSIERHLSEFGEVLAEDLGVPLREAKEHLDAAVDDGPGEELRRATRSIETAISLVDDLATVHSFSVEPRHLSESMRESAPGAAAGNE
ncbi:PAS domain-containing protein [Halorubrum kocurii]|uniref:histidine kinase n=1 Tax=Halorubrum kocurii JCM 14978 TaxID=1230456 RepID=M0NRE5_9EURY|nr:PAS domain S-box protein [Halorubrum kocurii]EMA59794.1 PAS/PAC sensor protein [Halorubrum kocurii JCM 14978]